MLYRGYDLTARFPYRQSFSWQNGFIKKNIKKLILWALDWECPRDKEPVCEFGALAAIGFKHGQHENDYIWGELDMLHSQMTEFQKFKKQSNDCFDDILFLAAPIIDLSNKFLIKELNKISKKRGFLMNDCIDVYSQLLNNSESKTLKDILDKTNLVLAEKQLRI